MNQLTVLRVHTSHCIKHLHCLDRNWHVVPSLLEHFQGMNHNATKYDCRNHWKISKGHTRFRLQVRIRSHCLIWQHIALGGGLPATSQAFNYGKRVFILSWSLLPKCHWCLLWFLWRICEFIWKMEWQKEERAEFFFLLGHSPRGFNSQDWIRLKLGT